MTNLITFSANADFAALEQRIQQIYKIDDYDGRISATVELLDVSQGAQQLIRWHTPPECPSS